MNKTILIALALVSTVSLSARQDRSKEKIETLKNSIEAVISSSQPHLNIGIEVVSLKTGQTLYEKNAKNLFVPASIAKLFTCAAALDSLGPEYQFETRVLKDDAGNLYILGAGDPSLDLHALEDLARQISLTAEKHFAKDLVVDNSLFDNIVSGPGWMWDEGLNYWNAPIDALLVDHSCVSLWIRPNEVKQPPEIVIQSGSDYVVVDNTAITSDEKGELEVERAPLARENKIEVRGVLAPSAPACLFRVPVEVPHQYAAHLFQKCLQNQGITFDGTTHVGKAPKGAKVIATHQSLPLSVLIRRALKDSDNLTANCFFKKLGQALEGIPGTWQNGSKAVRSFLHDRARLDTSEMVLLDGSGESRYNLASPHQMVQFLRWVSSQFMIGPEMLTALSLNGIDGSLKARMPKIRGKIRAKPGTMTGISSLAGFVEAEDGEVLAFSIMINGFTEKAREIKAKVEDPICQVLAQFSHR